MSSAAFIGILKWVALCYGGLLALLYFGQGYLIFAPWAVAAPSFDGHPLRPAFEQAQAQTQDGLDLAFWHAAPQEGKPVIVFFHGNAIHALQGIQRAAFFHQAGYGFVMAEYRGYGGNKGRPTEQGLYQDARAVINKVKVLYPDAPLVMYGESIGTGVAVQMATEFPAEFPAAAVVLEAPYTSITDVGRAQYPIFPVALLLRHKFESDTKITEIHNAPLLIIHGTRDTIVPYRLGRGLYERAAEPKFFLEVDGAGHNDLHAHNILPRIEAFLSNKGEGGPSE